MKITRRQLRKIILRETRVLSEEAIMMEPQAIADIEKSITLNSLDSYGQRNKAVDKGRLHAIIGDEHSREDVDAVIAQVNEKYGTDFAVISAHARTGRFQVTTHLYLVSGGATEVSG